MKNEIKLTFKLQALTKLSIVTYTGLQYQTGS